jgi:hypothetical protein
MKIRITAFIFGIAFLAAGLAWHIPLFFDNNGLLFGLFQIDSIHNKVHLGSGLIALGAAATSGWWAKLYFKVFGGIYLMLSILGWIFSDEFMTMQINTADNILHLAIGVVALMIGYGMTIPPGE